MRRSTQEVAEGQRQIAQEAAQTFGDVSRKMAQAAQGTSEEMRRFAVLPHAAEGGLRDMQQGMAGLVAGVMQTNLRATQELFRLANPAAVIELQQRFVPDAGFLAPIETKRAGEQAAAGLGAGMAAQATQSPEAMQAAMETAGVEAAPLG